MTRLGSELQPNGQMLSSARDAGINGAPLHASTSGKRPHWGCEVAAVDRRLTVKCRGSRGQGPPTEFRQSPAVGPGAERELWRQLARPARRSERVPLFLLGQTSAGCPSACRIRRPRLRAAAGRDRPAIRWWLRSLNRC